MVDMGVGMRAWVPAFNGSARANPDHAIIQQILPTGGRQPSGPATCSGPPDWISCAKHPGNGWKQTLAALERVFYGTWALAKNSPVRHAGSATVGKGIGSRARARNRSL